MNKLKLEKQIKPLRIQQYTDTIFKCIIPYHLGALSYTIPFLTIYLMLNEQKTLYSSHLKQHYQPLLDVGDSSAMFNQHLKQSFYLKATEINLDLSLKATTTHCFSPTHRLSLFLEQSLLSFSQHSPQQQAVPQFQQSTAITEALNIWALRLTLWKVITQVFGLYQTNFDQDFTVLLFDDENLVS